MPLPLLIIPKNSMTIQKWHNQQLLIWISEDNNTRQESAMNQQLELFDIKNPCIGVCQSNNEGYCFGCLRSRTERQLWYKMSPEQRREVLRLLVGRQQRIEQIRQLKGQQLRFNFEEILEAGELF